MYSDGRLSSRYVDRDPVGRLLGMNACSSSPCDPSGGEPGIGCCFDEPCVPSAS